jgi:hypothetical protein
MLLAAYVCCSNFTLMMIDLAGITQGRLQENWHLPCMNASNHFMRAASSLAREKKGLGAAITAKDGLQYLVGALVECSGRVQ